MIAQTAAAGTYWGFTGKGGMDALPLADAADDEAGAYFAERRPFRSLGAGVNARHFSPMSAPLADAFDAVVFHQDTEAARQLATRQGRLPVEGDEAP